MKIGATYLGNGRCEFVIWAPLLPDVTVRIVSPSERVIPMTPLPEGYWGTVIEGLSPGDQYVYQIAQGRDRPDPASYSQPLGVHGPSEIIDHTFFPWEDGHWRGIPLSDMIQYELHVGSFTPEGTFDAVIPRLDALREIGINAVELMPVAQFPGERNWGYDGAYPYAVQTSYGGPDQLKRLVNACHKQGLAVILDVVYNHLGPEGNYLAEFAPYFTDHYRSPWGEAVNFDGAYSDGVKNYFVENALYWFREYHVDGLRLDAIHGIFDRSASPFLAELAEAARNFSARAGRKYYLIAESDLEDVRVIRPPDLGGYGLDAQWCDDFHHAVRTLLTREDRGYFADYGRIDHLAKALREGFVYSGQYSRYRKRRHGSSSKDRPAEQFVVFCQNHDQVGNRLNGDRLSRLVPFEALKLAAGILLLSPYVPLLFMGEEYGETAPFLYFVSHSDPGLIEAVRRGRKEEFRSFQWAGDPPDPQSTDTFLRSRIDWTKREEGHHRVLMDYYKSLIRLRREIPAIGRPDKDRLGVLAVEKKRLLYLKRWSDSEQLHCLFNFGPSDADLETLEPSDYWKAVSDSADPRWNGPGSLLPKKLRGHSVAVFREASPPPVIPADEA
jgi:maltooligosyltrehalose trehalohydrolase